MRRVGTLKEKGLLKTKTTITTSRIILISDFRIINLLGNISLTADELEKHYGTAVATF